ncbi:uncharacterized protein AB675_2486 [Cyphellophora attinorum]|uniref:Uncharacterized protein n=1 Tax=Cyphellophora attinorum TaxID=1664694 RepID=A0A0N1P3E8_9EURO|nr:uncharacterized protein AB675_2486 [Phialophora attinorum]KPI45065.1 hypothetical protein AB675_2486 [Phialophora attinorum]
MPPEDLTAERNDSTDPDPNLVLYIKHLPDTVHNYRRFFNSLLVPRPDHEIFLRDLRHFREQAEIIVLLTTPASDGTTNGGSPTETATSNAEANATTRPIPTTVSDIYRQTTTHFLASRFAHPYCRNEYGHVSTSHASRSFFDKTTVSKRKQADAAAEAKAREDERIHKLLVPIWIAFRRRMMVTAEELTAWVEDWNANEYSRWKAAAEDNIERKGEARTALHLAPEDKDPMEEQRQVPAHNERSGTYLNAAEAFVSEEGDLVDAPSQQHDTAAQAGGLFVGVAAASFLASNKRARKYLLKKMKQK